jgi:hypothetical protein
MRDADSTQDQSIQVYFELGTRTFGEELWVTWLYILSEVFDGDTYLCKFVLFLY